MSNFREMNKGLDFVSASCIVAAALGLVGIFDGQNLDLWALTSVSLPIALTLAGGRKAPPVILLNVGLFWLAIYCSLLSLYLSGKNAEMTSGQYSAILYSLLAMFFLAFGFKTGFKPEERSIRLEAATGQISVQKAFAAYLAALILTSALTSIAAIYPALSQPLTAFNVLKLLVLYILCIECLMQGRMHIYILIALVLELLIGMTNFIASYQPAFVTVLAAILNWAGGRFSLAKLFAAATVLFVFFWTSLIWTAIKPEFRRWLFEADPAVTASWTQRSDWILDRLGEELDLQKAGVKLADRIGYTQLYALAIPLLDVTEGRRSNYLLGAVEEVLMPRVLFPDKPILNDTKITMELTGLQFNKSTSVSIGYVAEATADFGFYGMLLELFAIGWVLGFFAMRLTKADIRPLEQQAFITAALAYKFFYQLNIDKSIATFSLQAIALVLFLKYCYGGFERLLIVPSRRSTKSAKASKQLAAL